MAFQFFPSNLIGEKNDFARRAAASHRASSAFEQAGLQRLFQVEKARARAVHEEREQGIISNATSARDQARNNYGNGSLSWTTPQETLLSYTGQQNSTLIPKLQLQQYTCKQSFPAAIPPRHQITPELRRRTPASPPPLLHVSSRCLVPRDNCTNGSKSAGNWFGANRERHLQEEMKSSDETLFAQVQSFRKALNNVYPPPPLVKKGNARDLSREPPVSLFSDMNKHRIKRAPHVPSSDLQPAGQRYAQISTRNNDLVNLAFKDMSDAKTSANGQLTTGFAKTINDFARPKPPPLLSNPGTCTQTKQRCSTVSTDSVAPCSLKRRCSSIPPAIPPISSHASDKRVKMSSSHSSSSPSASTDRSQMHRRAAAITETPPPFKHNGSSVVHPGPASRWLETNDPESCGGFAYDHDSMPKIIAVHSVTWKEDDMQRSAPSKGVALAQHHNENVTMRGGKDRAEAERPNQSRLNAHAITTVAGARQCYSRERSPLSMQSEAKSESTERLELSRDATNNVTNGYNPATRQTNEGTQSIGGNNGEHRAKQRNNGVRQLVRLAPATPQISNVATARHEFGDMSSFYSRNVLRGRVHQNQDLSGYHLNMTSQKYENASIALKSRQSLQSASTTAEQTVMGILSVGNSGQLKFALQANPHCKTPPNEMQNRNEQEGMLTKQNLPISSPTVSLHEKTSKPVDKVDIEENEATSTKDKLEELCRKILETRERFNQENIKWKKKILRSLEIVLIKRLRKAERDTGKKADINVADEPNAGIHGKLLSTLKKDNKIDKKQRRQSNAIDPLQ